MKMGIDESGDDKESLSIDVFPCSGKSVRISNCDNPPMMDQNISPKASARAHNPTGMNA